MSEEGKEAVEKEKLEINAELLVKYKVHYGRRVKTSYMEKYIYKIHPKGFFLIDVNKTLEKLRVAAKFLASFPPENVLICSSREYAKKGIEKMCELTGMTPITGRFLPGTISNYLLEFHKDPELVFIVDAFYDNQPLKEASKMRIPVIALCDTNTYPSYIDLVIPANNKGKSSLAIIFWVLTNFYLREKGVLKEDELIDVSPEEFEVEL